MVYPTAQAGDRVAGEHAFWSSDLGSGKYGSFPVKAFKSMTQIFPERFPKNLELIGLYPKPPERDDGLPAGFVKTQQLGIEFASSNCGLCHLGRLPGTDQLYPGVSNADFDVQTTAPDFLDMIMDDRMTPEAVFAATEARGETVSLYERAIMRLWLWGAKRQLKAKPKLLAGGSGPGRSDAVNSWKRVLRLPKDAITFVDIPVIYNQKLKTLTLYDGSITGDPAARVMLTEIQKGRPPSDVLQKRQVFDDLLAYLNEGIAPPRYPYAVDAALAKKGEEIFNDNCARCHGHYGETRDYPNKRVPIEKVGTDPERAHAIGQSLADALHATAFRDYLAIDSARVYVPPPLDGVWASAPYLHNGSVPSLADLFEDEDARPVAFYRRVNAFDSARVGFACNKRKTVDGVVCDPDPRQESLDPEHRWLYRFDTKTPGNSNRGHPFTVDLEPAEKPAVLEYLKTL